MSATAENPHKRNTKHSSLLTVLPDRQLLPRDLRGLPPAIEKANRTAHERHDRMVALGAAARAARQKAKTAGATDQRAANAAAAIGKDPPKPTVGPTAVAAQEADRAARAAEAACVAAVHELHDAVAEGFPQYLELRERDYEQAQADLAEAMQVLPSMIDRVRVTGAALSCARSWHNNARSADLMSTPGAISGRRLDRETERARAAWGSPGAPHITPDVASVVAWLTVALSHEADVRRR